MKLQFDSDLDFQLDAVNAVADLFEGQETLRSQFSVAALDDQYELDPTSDLGYGNRLKLLPEEILANLNNVQLRNGLEPSKELGKGTPHFTVEMETGTGKTYVYLRTILELNRRYGFTKFIIVVPSLAIKEGTYKSLQITQDHLKALFANVSYDYFVYDSEKLSDVRNFATSDSVQIMVINIDAFRKSFDGDPARESKSNVIHRPQDRMMGAKPIDFIRDTNPILIIDEPQSVDTTPKSKEAIASLNPLCTLRYSATHKDKHHQVFRLDSVDAYERKLVKQIEVAGLTLEANNNQPYIRLVKVDNKKGGITAKLELDIKVKGTISRKTKTVRQGADLCEVTGGREQYENFVIEEISCREGDEFVAFTNRDERVRVGQAIGEVNDDAFKREQIKKTIEEHLRKELRLRPKGLKVLSLFFIDKVANYRDYDAEGHPVPGKYAVMFEEEYAKAIRRTEFSDLFRGVDLTTAVEGVHNGYFATDKKKDSKGEERFKESKGDGKTAADGSAYELIMRDKERLLSFDSKLKFIFSHSALREGWDNPNVFQICTLNETTSVMKKRQEIGRGLRLAVNQDGERVREDGVNVLTVMANESYEEFARKLQQEIEDDTGIRFGLVEKHLFAALPVVAADGVTTQPLGLPGSEEIWDHFHALGYIDSKKKVTDSLRIALKTGTVSIPEKFETIGPLILGQLKKVAGDLPIKNADERKPIRLNKERFLSPDFKELWDRIKFKTTFRVDFNVEELIQECAQAIRDSVNVPKPRYVYTVAKADIDRGGVSMVRDRFQTDHMEAGVSKPPDILTVLQNETHLTRRTLAEILTRAGNLKSQFQRNPVRYIEQVSKIIRAKMHTFIVDGIKYHRLGENEFYAQELFQDHELFGYLEKNLLAVQGRCIYDHVIYDSEVEREFAQNLNAAEEVKVFAKLPSWFKIETPLGSYNPDWAVLVNRSEDQDERLYFVVETKGEALLDEALRPTEAAKIKCGKAHFAALGTDVTFQKVSNFGELVGGLS